MSLTSLIYLLASSNWGSYTKRGYKDNALLIGAVAVIILISFIRYKIKCRKIDKEDQDSP